MGLPYEFLQWQEKLKAHKLPLWDELTDIELYMDQVTGLLDKYLSVYVKEGADKMISASMVNNYVKMGIIPPPVNKRYGKAQIAGLIMVLALKQVLSMSEIKDLLEKKIQKHDISVVYNEFCAEQKSAYERMLSLCFGSEPLEELDSEALAFRMAILAMAGRSASAKILEITNTTEETKRQEVAAEEKAAKKAKKT